MRSIECKDSITLFTKEGANFVSQQLAVLNAFKSVCLPKSLRKLFSKTSMENAIKY